MRPGTRLVLTVAVWLPATLWGAPQPAGVDELNRNSAMPLDRNSRVLLREVVINGASRTIREPFVSLLKSALLEAGVTYVATPEEVRRETAQRREERANDEVQASTLPPKATIVRENVEARVTLDIAHEEKDLQGLLANLGGSRYIRALGGLAVKKKQSTAVVTLALWDNTSLTSRTQLTAMGQEKDVAQVIIGVLPVILRDARSEQDKRDLKAAGAALASLRDTIRGQVQSKPLRIRGSVLGTRDRYVIIDVGAQNGVKVGMVLTVHPIVVHGNIRTHLPPSGTIRVVTVDANSAAAEVVSGDIARMQSGDMVTLAAATPTKAAGRP